MTTKTRLLTGTGPTVGRGDARARHIQGVSRKRLLLLV
jgi:hypothetical protein